MIKEQLVKKSRTQKIFGWLMVGTGVPAVIGSVYLLTFSNDVLSEKGKVALALAGSIAYTWVGAHFIRKGAKNKEKLVQIELGRQQIMLPGSKQLMYSMQTSVSLRFCL